MGSAKNNLKGKISRTLANKAALCVRSDALGETPDGALGIKNRSYLEGRLKLLESGGKVVKAKFEAGGQKKWEAKADSKGYNQGGDWEANKRQRTA